MIKGADVVHVLHETVPFYIVMLLAFVSVRWLKLFSPEQCAGIIKLAGKILLPFLSLKFIIANNPYEINARLLYSDFLQKLLAFLVLVIFTRCSSHGRLLWIVTGLSLITLPNTMLLAVPMMKAAYGEETVAQPLTQIVAFQSLIWYNVLVVLYELNAVRAASSVVPSGTGDVEREAQGSEGRDSAEESNSGATGDSSRAPMRRHGTIDTLLAVGKRLLLNPNPYTGVLGLTWACTKFRWKLELTAIIQKTIDLLAEGASGLAVLTLGLHMAMRGKVIACGVKVAIFSMGMKLILGAILMAAPCVALRMKGTLLKVSVIQAAFPLGIVPFIFSTVYDVHTDIMSTGVIFGMLISLPLALLYYLLFAPM